LFAICGLSEDGKIIFQGEGINNPLAEDGVIVDNDKGDLVHRSAREM
jgi:hypothetical protein